MPIVKFKVGLKDLETREEKRLGWAVLVYFLSTMGCCILTMVTLTVDERESEIFLAITMGLLFCAYEYAKRLCELYDARMDPTKDLEDYDRQL